MSNKRIDLETLDEIAKNAQEMCNHERLLRVNVFAAESVVRELIAELKRCYEELDKWTEYATYVENVNMDCHQDACAEAGFLWKCTDCGAHFELPEDGIYKCEFGCDASE